MAETTAAGDGSPPPPADGHRDDGDAASEAPRQPAPARTRRTPRHSAPAPPQQWYQAQPIPQNQTYQQLCSAPLPFSEKWHIAKLILSAVSLVSCTIVIATSIALVVIWAMVDMAWQAFVAAVTVAAAAMVWQVAEGIVLCARRKRRGIHPGAHVGVQLVISIGAGLVMGFLATMLAYFIEARDEYSSSGGDYSDTYSSSGYYYGGYFDCYASESYCQSYATGGLSIYATILTFVIIIFIVHSVLFVRACVETHQRNTAHKTIILVPSGALTVPMSSIYMMQPTTQSYNASTPMQPITMTPAGARHSRAAAAVSRQNPRPTSDRTTPSPPDRRTSDMHGYYAPQSVIASPAPQPSRATPAVPRGDGDQGKGKAAAPPQLPPLAVDVSPEGSEAGDRRSTHETAPSGSGSGAIGQAC